MTGDFELSEEIKAMRQLADDLLRVDGTRGYHNPSGLKSGQIIAISDAINSFDNLVESNIQWSVCRENLLAKLRQSMALTREQ